MNEKELRLHKTLSAVDAVISGLTTAGLVMYFLDFWKGALNVCIPLLGVSLVISGVRFQRSNRTVSILCYCVAAFILICCIGVFLV